MSGRIYRSNFQDLARLRLRDAEILLDAKEWAGAYYLAGYVVECSLKACIARATERFEFPDRDRAKEAWSHNADQLVNVADLKADFDIRSQADHQFASYWAFVAGPTGWSENSRYRWDIAENEARDLYKAITDSAHGILAWIKNHW